MAAPTSASVVDGRRLHSERIRQLVIEAYLAPLREDPRVPTSAQIAEPADYERSGFGHFPDLLSLRMAATGYAFALCNALAVVRRLLWRALNANRGDDSAGLRLRIRPSRELIMKRLERMFIDFENRARMGEFCGLFVEKGCDRWIRITRRILLPIWAR